MFKLQLRHAYNDVTRNKGVNIALFVVLILSAFLVATGSMVMEQTVGSVNQLFDEAKPPHFLQMHKGDYDPEALNRFASEHPEIDSWLVEEMLGYEGAAIAWHRPSTGESGDLSESLIDNLFVTQNHEFDFLLDAAGDIPRPSSGEVYAPVAYQQAFDLQVGDELNVRTDSGNHDLRIQGFVRDSQMASSMSSATRFLVSDADFQRLEAAGGGVPEIILEYRGADPSGLSGLQSAYESDESLPKTGQAISFGMIRIINSFSNGLVAVALVFISFLLITIALINSRFMIRGTLEDEVHEIGAMKAIGLPDKMITRLYLSKYRVMTLLACILGGVLAVPATSLLTQTVQTNYAEASVGIWTVLIPVVSLILVYLFVIAICRRVFRRIRKIQVVNALVHGSTLDDKQIARRATRQAKRVRRSRLDTGKGNVSLRLALSDIRTDGKQWILIPLVFFLASVVMTLPMNLLSTFESPRFVTYMGAPESDLLVDLQFSDDIDEMRQKVLFTLEGDDRLTDVRAFSNLLYETRGEEGWETLRVEVGDYSGGTVEFLEGDRPDYGQIALSVLNADKYQVSTGDTLTVRHGGESTETVVSGVYQDVTSGGYTAKMQGEVTSGAPGYVIYANTVDGEAPVDIAADYSSRFPGAAVFPMQEYAQQTLSFVTGAFQNASILALIFGIGVAALITGMFLKLRLASERRRMGVLSAIGFSTGEIISQVRVKTIVAMAVGILLGVVFAMTTGESLVSLLISAAGLGIADLDLIPNPSLVYIVYPLTLIAAGYLVAVTITAGLRRADKSSWLTG